MSGDKQYHSAAEVEITADFEMNMWLFNKRSEPEHDRLHGAFTTQGSRPVLCLQFNKVMVNELGLKEHTSLPH